MKIYALRNADGEYISNTVGFVTLDWLRAKKFYREDIEKETRYIDPSFKLVEFEIKEVYVYE